MTRSLQSARPRLTKVSRSANAGRGPSTIAACSKVPIRSNSASATRPGLVMLPRPVPATGAWSTRVCPRMSSMVSPLPVSLAGNARKAQMPAGGGAAAPRPPKPGCTPAGPARSAQRQVNAPEASTSLLLAMPTPTTPETTCAPRARRASTRWTTGCHVLRAPTEKCPTPPAPSAPFVLPAGSRPASRQHQLGRARNAPPASSRRAVGTYHAHTQRANRARGRPRAPPHRPSARNAPRASTRERPSPRHGCAKTPCANRARRRVQEPPR